LRDALLLAPSLSQTLREDLQCLTCPGSEQEPGIHRVSGLPFPAWVVETDTMAERDQMYLSRTPLDVPAK
jgi:hypothetical protein